MPSPDDVHRIIELVGRPIAKTMLMAGQRISAEQAVRVGLAEKVSDIPAEAIGKISGDMQEGKFVSGLAIKRLVDSKDMGERPIGDCYSAVYDSDTDAMARLLRQRWFDAKSGIFQ